MHSTEFVLLVRQKLFEYLTESWMGNIVSSFFPCFNVANQLKKFASLCSNKRTFLDSRQQLPLDLALEDATQQRMGSQVNAASGVEIVIGDVTFP